MKEDPNRLSTKDIANATAERRDARAVDPTPPERPAEPPPPQVPPQQAAPPRQQQPPQGPSPREHPQQMPAPHPVATEAERDVIFPHTEADAFRTRWEAIQTGFVDEPRNAVTEADALVAQVVTRLAEVFSTERANLEKHWDHGQNISTEDLRIALRRYRSFFDRLLSV